MNVVKVSSAFFWVAGAIVYLTLPYYLFGYGWLNLPAALALGGCLALGSWLTVRDYGSPDMASAFARLRPRTLLAVFALALAVVMISGIGGFGFQDYDWQKHNFLLSDLVRQSWPVSYTYFGFPIALVYYFAYYLPAAFIGHVLGWPAANLTLAAWSIFGITVVLYLLLQLVKPRKAWVTLVVFLLFSGLDVVGAQITHSPLSSLWPERAFPTTWTLWTNQDAWSAWQYSSNIKLLFSVPNQAIAGWLITSLLLLPLLNDRRSRSVLFLLGISAFWSPFVTLGLAPLLLLYLLPQGQGSARKWKDLVSVQNVIGLVILALVTLFYAAKLAPLAPLQDQGFRVGIYLAAIDGWLHRFYYVLLLLLFYVIEFGIWGWFIWRSGILRRPSDRRLFWLTTAWLVFLPLWVFGAANDLVMRASIPALWTYTVLLALALSEGHFRRTEYAALLIALVVAGLNPFEDVAVHGAEIAARGSLLTFPAPNKTIVDELHDNPNRLIQYVGSEQSPFFALLSAVRASSPGAPTGAPILFGDRLVLTQYRLQQERLFPGAETKLMLRLTSWKPLGRNLNLATRLVDANGGVIWEQQGWPSGRETATWEPFDTYIDARQVHIPPDAAPGTYVLQAYFSESATQSKLPVTLLPDRVLPGDLATLAYLNVETPKAAAKLVPATPGSAPLAAFGESLELVSASVLDPTSWATDGRVAVKLVWQARRAMVNNYVQTLQLIDDKGTLVAQQDRQLFNGALPTTAWKPDLEVQDSTVLTLPHIPASGHYRLIVAWYDPQTGKRLALPASPQTVDNAYILAQLSAGAH